MPDVVFIHGMFQNPHSWADWVKRFAASGYRSHAPAWPFHDGEPARLRSVVDPQLGKLTLGGVVDHLARFLETLVKKPVLVGHSMGGLAAQILVNRNLAACAVCIDTAAPNGMLVFQQSFFKSNFPTINPLKGNTPFSIPKEHFHHAFCNVMTRAESDAAYEAFVVPESRNVARSSALGDGRINLSLPHVPLLFIAGENDHIIPAALNRKNANGYTDKNSATEFKEFPGRSHFICGQRGWEEVADFVIGWLEKQRV